MLHSPTNPISLFYLKFHSMHLRAQIAIVGTEVEINIALSAPKTLGPDQGRVAINDTDLKDFQTSELRANVSIALQQNILYEIY